MKRLLLLAALSSPTAARAQQADSTRGLRRLDRQRCFAGVCLGKQKPRTKDYDKSVAIDHQFRIHLSAYRAEKLRRLYGLQVLPHHIMMVNDGRIRTIVLHVPDSLTGQRLLHTLLARYGPTSPSSSPNKQTYYWMSDRVYLRYSIVSHSSSTRAVFIALLKGLNY